VEMWTCLPCVRHEKLTLYIYHVMGLNNGVGSPYFHMESLSVGYLAKFFSSSTSARWIPSLVETFVQHKSSWRASLISLDESFKKRKR
jgi:hypothetical protein